MGGSRRKPSLDFFPRIVDVLKWHLPTLRKIERNLFSSPPSSFFWPDQTFAIENISYLLQEKIYVKLFEGKAEIRQKRVNRKFLGSWAAKFCSSPSTSISKPKISPLHWGAKSGGTIKNETTWYQIRCGMGFTLVCAACSLEKENGKIIWTVASHKRESCRAGFPFPYELMQIGCMLLLLLPFQASVRPFRGKWDLNLNCKVRREKRWKSAIPFCIATATVFSNNDHVLFQHNHHFLGKFGPI